MDKLFKLVIGPYEIFASIIGGLPYSISLFLFLYPDITWYETIKFIDHNLKLNNVLLVVFLTYILGDIVQLISWRYFEHIIKCNKNKGNTDTGKEFLKIFRRYNDFQFNKELLDKETFQKKEEPGPKGKTPDPEEKIYFQKRLSNTIKKDFYVPEYEDSDLEKVGYFDSVIKAYLREHNKSALIDAEYFQATHIMYRNLSLGFLFIFGVKVFNIARYYIDIDEIRSHGLDYFSTINIEFMSVIESLFIFIALWCLSQLAFERAYKFIVWFKREIYLGYYFAVTNQK